MLLGNQVDLTVSDMLRAVGWREDIHTLGVYVEGFNDLDGLDMLQAVRVVTDAGKTVVFYKAAARTRGRRGGGAHGLGRGRLRHLRGGGYQRRCWWRKRSSNSSRAVARVEGGVTPGWCAARAWARSRTRGLRRWGTRGGDRIRGPKYEVQLPVLSIGPRADRGGDGEESSDRACERSATRST